MAVDNKYCCGTMARLNLSVFTEITKLNKE